MVTMMVMPQVYWDEVADWFDPQVNGTLPDVHVPDTTIEDWQAVLDLVRSRGWAHEYEVAGRAARMPVRVRDMIDRCDDGVIQIRVWPAPAFQLIFRIYALDQIDFDVDLRQLQGQDRLDLLCAVLRAIGRRLHKPVLMTPEGSPAAPILGYDVDADRVVSMLTP